MIGSLVIAVIAVALTVAAVLCARGTISRNPVVGIRIASFFESDEAWRAGHRVASVPMAVAACVCVGLVLVAAEVPAYGGSSTAVIVSTMVLAGGVIVGAVLGSRALRRDDQ